MTDIKIKFVMISKDESFDMPFEMTDKINEMYPNISFEYVSNNKIRLPEVYNRYLLDARKNKNLDYLAFLHADVSFDIIHLVEHVAGLNNKYSVIGLCGCSKIVTSVSPLNWFNGSRYNPECRWGFVHHTQHNSDLFWNKHTPNVLDHEVSCIDGLFMMINRDIIENTNFQFDVKFFWDFYDTDLSFEMMINYKKKIGVIVEPSVKHGSIGMSILTDDFLRHEINFRNKWGLKIPDDSPIKTKGLI